ncbi:transcriptional regulator, LysR family [Ruegeria halocynthiae]|uniref:Transcriptional regulator, LysR family n=1 Tax=Ruegeria halocynthiae TaxID=985054 RepID=A0A1H2ZGL5_9RHOB|nr:LysR family transcriptional regulator [Ruegeria halocynthiae]SDX16516.1 transcriptional regulator, LysR family [Ruegeria halocynthiae]
MTYLSDFDWNHIRAFLTTAETGSLSAAARQLGQTQPTLSRQIAALEADLGVMLFERVGRSLEITQAGVELLDHTRTMGEAANRISLAASGQAQSIEGSVRITASDVMAAYILPDLLREIRTQAPRLRIDVIASNDIRDLMRREADIAIRHVRPDQPDLIAKLVQEASGHFYATTEYLNRAGRPTCKGELSQHEFISFGDTAQMIAYLKPLCINLSDENFRLGSQNGIVAWEYAKQGFGIAPMSQVVGDATPGVERVIPEMEPITFPIWLTTHRELHTSRRIRLVFDLLAAFLSK